jgi:hypothetical protein
LQALVFNRFSILSFEVPAGCFGVRFSPVAYPVFMAKKNLLEIVYDPKNEMVAAYERYQKGTAC